MKKVLLSSIATFVLFSSLMLIATSQECRADAYWFDAGLSNPANLVAYSTDSSLIDLAFENTTVGTPVWDLWFNVNSGGYSYMGQGDTKVTGLMSGFTLELYVTNSSKTLTLGGQHLVSGVWRDDAKLVFLDESTATIKWDTNNDGKFSSADKTTTVAMVASSAVPVPPSVLLLGSGLLGLLGIGLRRRNG